MRYRLVEMPRLISGSNYRRQFLSVTRHDVRYIIAVRADVHLQDKLIENLRVCDCSQKLMNLYTTSKTTVYGDTRYSTNMELIMLKNPNGKTSNTKKNIIPHDVPEEYFDNLPYTRMLGTLCIYSIDDEDDDTITFICDLVDPSDRPSKKYIEQLNKEWNS